jgi:hypothetical protein
VSLLHQQKPFLGTNAWQKPRVNSLRYNTSQVGSVLPIVFGTTRQTVNLIALGDYSGPSGGKKGGTTTLPLGGTANTTGGKGGGGSKSGGKKGSGDYSVDVAFALCQGPVDIGDENLVWSSAGTAFFQSVGLNLYTGEDGQAADPVFLGLNQVVGYSGTCYVTGTPLDLGKSPVLPNISFEITGFETGTAGPTYPKDANPANIVSRFLTDERWGADWPTDNLDPDLTTLGTNNYADYCQAAQLVMSVTLDSQTDAATWVHEIAKLTNVGIVFSGTTLKFIPYGDLQLSSNDATWVPDLTVQYSFTDDDFLPWTPHIDVEEPPVGDDDPVIITRANPADATNWMSIEYEDRINIYNKTLIPQFDQASIDLYGIKTEPAVQGQAFTDKYPAGVSLRLLLQRALYVRNTYKFQVGWQYSRLEPMDIVLVTDADLLLFEQPVRIIEIDENENGDLIITAEEIKVDISPPVACLGNMAWSAQDFVPNFYRTAPRIDSLGNFYVMHTFNVTEVFDSTGTIISSMTNADLAAAVASFTGLTITPLNSSSGPEMHPIYDGSYVIAPLWANSTHAGRFAKWFVLLEPSDSGNPTVVGAYHWDNLTWPPYAGPANYNLGIANEQTKDDPILFQAYAFLGSTYAVICALPSINEFLDGSYASGWSATGYTPYEIPTTYISPISSDDLSRNLFVVGANNPFGGFVLPDSDGGTNLYYYINRVYLDYNEASTSFTNTEIKSVIQPGHPYGVMLKVPLGVLSFSDLAGTAVSSGSGASALPPGGTTEPYTIDDANWRKGAASAIPFNDEHTNISTGESAGADSYMMQPGGVSKNSDGTFYVSFFMPGNSTSADTDDDLWETVRVFKYTPSTEVALQIGMVTCRTYTADQIPFVASHSRSDYYQAVSIVNQSGRRMVRIHGYNRSGVGNYVYSTDFAYL